MMGVDLCPNQVAHGPHGGQTIFGIFHKLWIGQVPVYVVLMTGKDGAPFLVLAVAYGDNALKSFLP
jgi:hypothetical protein